MQEISPYQLWATIYMPSTRDDLIEFVCNKKIPELKSMVICLEDAILENEIEIWLKNIENLLDNLENQTKNPLVFIRPRNPKMALEIYKINNIEKINGFVLPKFDNISFLDWLEVINSSPKNFIFMPTLETSDVLNPYSANNLCEKLINNGLKNRILALRIGWNDLLSCLRLRRNKENTIYDSPLNYTIWMLINIFASKWFYLTAPVWENFKNNELLEKEFKLDLQHGLIWKTVIHPTQIKYIHELLKVSNWDYESAKMIIDKNSKAVFQINWTMCEPATHYNWALEIIERFKYFGLEEEKQE